MTGPDPHPREALSAYLDDALGIEERSVVDRHLASCEDCRAELAALERLAAAMRAERIPPPPADLAVKIALRLEPGEPVRRGKLRFAVPATIAATLGAIGVLFALRWQGERPLAPAPLPPPSAQADVKVEPQAASPSPAPQRERAAQDELAAARADRPAAAAAEPSLQKSSVQPPPAPVAPAEAERRAEAPTEGGSAGSALGTVNSVAPGTQGRVGQAAEVPAAQALPEQAPPLREQRSQAAAPQAFVKDLDRSAKKAEVAAECGERWSDSGVRATWAVANPVDAALRLDRMARETGGRGTWWGVADGRPYVLVIPRSRFQESLANLRARGVTGLDPSSEIAPGDDCLGVSIALIESTSKP